MCAYACCLAASTLKQLRQLTESTGQLVLIVNPQWETQGNLISGECGHTYMSTSIQYAILAVLVMEDDAAKHDRLHGLSWGP